MKKIWILVLVLVILTGCSAKQTMENVEDVYASVANQDRQSISLDLPSDAVLTMVNGDRKLYCCKGYEIHIETISSGDIDATLRMLTGYDRSYLTVMEISAKDNMRYECVWTAAGEAGEIVGRTVILDDGNYHYCLSILSSADDAGSLQETWNDLSVSFKI